MTHKQIDGAREVRLWIGQVIVPAVTAGILICSNPNARQWVSNKFSSIKTKFSRRK